MINLAELLALAHKRIPKYFTDGATRFVLEQRHALEKAATWIEELEKNQRTLGTVEVCEHCGRNVEDACYTSKNIEADGARYPLCPIKSIHSAIKETAE